MDPSIVKILHNFSQSTGMEKPTSPESDFKKVLEQQLSEDGAKVAQELLGASGANVSPIKAVAANPITIDPAAFPQGKEMNLVEIMGKVNRDAFQMDQIMELVTTGQSFTPQELLALQAGVYRIIEEINLTGQVVSSADRARNSLLNIQV